MIEGFAAGLFLGMVAGGYIGFWLGVVGAKRVIQEATPEQIFQLRNQDFKIGQQQQKR